MKTRITDNLFKRFVKKINPDSEFDAFLGNKQGTEVKADNFGNVYVTDMNGNELVVFNDQVPSILGRIVTIKRNSKNGKPSIVGFSKAYPLEKKAYVIEHSESHQWPNWDTLFSRKEQILHMIAIPEPETMSITFYGGNYYFGGFKTINNFTVDLTSYIIEEKAKWILCEISSSGEIFYTDGSLVDYYELLEYKDIPSPTPGRYPLFAIKIYSGQNQIYKSKKRSDVADFNIGIYSGLEGSEIFPSGANSVVFKNSIDEAETSTSFLWDESTKTLYIGEVAFTPTSNGIHITSDSVSSSNFLSTFGGATLASFLSFVKGRGTHDAIESLQNNDIIGRIRGRGAYDAGAITDTRIEIRFVSDGDWALDDTPTRIEFWATPDGSGTQELVATINANGINIEIGKEFTINGVPIGSGENIPILTSDPVSPGDGEMWLLRETTGAIPDGTAMGALGMTYTGNTGSVSPLVLSIWDDEQGSIGRLNFTYE